MKNLKIAVYVFGIAWIILFALIQNMQVKKYERENIRLSAEVKKLTTDLEVEKQGHQAALNTINIQNASIEAYQLDMENKLTYANLEIERIKTMYSGQRTKVIYETIKDPGCENSLRLITEIQEAFFYGKND